MCSWNGSGAFSRASRKAEIGFPAEVAGLPLLRALAWLALGLMVFLALLLAAALVAQWRGDRSRKHREACHARWERELASYLVQDGPDTAWKDLADQDRVLLLRFLQDALLSIGGAEAERIKGLAQALGLHEGLARRLSAFAAATRARAALEVGLFHRWEHLPTVRSLLNDPSPPVAFAAARTLARRGDLEDADSVVDWVLRQERVQQERLLRVMLGFGPGLLARMEARLAPIPAQKEGWRLYALLVAAFRDLSSEGRVLDLLRTGERDLATAALKALRAIGDPSAYGEVEPFAGDADWVLRGQAALAFGVLGGAQAIPTLLRMMEDRVFEVRRNAAQALAELGPAGVEALRWIAAGDDSDPFARDLAREQIQWLGAQP